MSEQIILLANPASRPNSSVFKVAFSECVDEVLSALGTNVKQAIYVLLEVEFGLTKEPIPDNVETFAAAIEKTFGQAATLLEIKILEKLQHRSKGFSFKSKKPDLLFTEYLAALQNRL